MNESLLRRNIGSFNNGGQNNFLYSLGKFNDGTENIEKNSSFNSIECAKQAVYQIMLHLAEIADNGFVDCSRIKGKTEGIVSTERYIDIVENTVKDGDCSLLDLLSHCSITNYLLHAKNILNQPNVNLDCHKSLFALGITMAKQISTTLEYQVLGIPGSANKIIEDVEEKTETATKKKSTENARQAKQEISDSNRKMILQVYEKLKRENPNMSKDKAAQMIGGIGKINLAPRVIRKYLNNK